MIIAPLAPATPAELALTSQDPDPPDRCSRTTSISHSQCNGAGSKIPFAPNCRDRCDALSSEELPLKRTLTTALLATVMVGAMTAPAFAQSRDLDCKDFTSQAAAQANLDANRSDPNRLDQDGDGKACETYTGPYKAAAAAPNATTTRKQTAAGSSTLPRTGPHDAEIIGATGLAFLAAGSLLVVAGRRRPTEACT